MQPPTLMQPPTSGTRCLFPLASQAIRRSVAGGAGMIGAVTLMGIGADLTHVILAAILASAAVIDGATGRIPNRLVAVGFIAILLSQIEGEVSLVDPVTAAVGCALVLWTLRIVGLLWTGHPGMGMGDVKLAIVLGLALGWTALWALYLSAVVAAAFGGAGLLFGWASSGTRLPFAPFIAAGTALHTLLPITIVSSLVAGG